MMRNPETAYLVSNEEFDKQIDELGWSAKGHRHDGRHVHRKERLGFQKGCAGFFAGGTGAVVRCRCPAYRHTLDIIPDSAIHTRPDSFCHIGLGRVSKYAFTMDVPLSIYRYTCRLPVSDLFSSVLAKIQVLMLENDMKEF